MSEKNVRMDVGQDKDIVNKRMNEMDVKMYVGKDKGIVNGCMK